jgi:DNA topoisomerase-1
VKELEADGIGRPSTYATIIDTIIERGYVQKQGQALVPTLTAFGVTALLEHHFPRLVDLKFTAGMEQTLDDISEGHAEWLPYLRDFYLGRNGLQQQVAAREKRIDPAEARTVQLGDLDGAAIRLGRFGPYLEVERGGEVVKASVPRDTAPADLSREKVEEILRVKAEGPEVVGHHPDTDEPILLLSGQYGPYVQLGTVSEANPKPRRASLPRGTKPDEVTLEIAVGLLSLPRLLGTHPAGGSVLAGQGRFGPYIVHDQGPAGKDYRSLKGDDHVLSVTLERALGLLAQPKGARGRRATAPLRSLGPHPADGQPVELFQGRYGPYVKHGSVSASVPRGRDPEAVMLVEAMEWLEAKGGARPQRPGRSARKAPPAAAPKPKAGPRRSTPDPLTARVKKARRGRTLARPATAAKR